MSIYRIALGMTVMAMLIPVVVVAVPDLLDQGADQNQAVARSDAQNRSPRADRALESAPGNPLARSGNDGPPEQGGGEPTTTTEAGTTTSATDGTTTTQPPDKTTTTAPPGTTSTTPPPAEADETITGSVCPCTVTGTSELKGTVSLQGDLTVDGGTLVARPGVDLDGNGFQIMFMNGGRADFQGTPVFTWSGDGSNANLTRDINFSNLRRIIFMGGGPSTLTYLKVANSGTPLLGDYPIHWHLNGNSTRGTLVKGVVVENGANHAFVPHGSHGIKFVDVIASNTRKTAFWWDAPGSNNCTGFEKFCTTDNSNDITYDHVLVDGVYETQGNLEHHRVSGFLLSAGSGNVIRNSVARDIEGGVDCSGFHWPGAANQNVGGNVWVAKNLRAYDDDCHGIFVWQNDGNHHVIEDFVGPGIDHGAYVNDYEYVGFDVPYVEVHATGWQMRDGEIGRVIVRRHVLESDPAFTLTNVQIGEFIVDNGSGDVPGTYVLNGTNLSCGDIEYQDVVPGTKVIIDGTEC